MSRLNMTILAPALLLGGAGAATALDITEETNANYQEYPKLIGSTKRGAFAVSPDGAYSWFIYCTDVNCITDGMGRDAMARCQRLSGQKCSLMAYGRGVRIPFTVFPDKVKAGDEVLAAVLSADQLKR